MSTIITTSTTSTTGYKLLVTEADGLVHEYEINEFDPNNQGSLKLPENPANRKYFSVKKIEAAGGTIELTYKEAVKLGERQTTNRTKLEDFMTEEEKATIAMIMERAKTRREDARKKPLTEKEKAQRKLDKAIEELKSLGMTDEEIQTLLAR